MFALVLSLAACGDDKDNQETSEGSKKVLNVGSSGIYPPFISVDADGKAQWYDVEVLEKVALKKSIRHKNCGANRL